jgi:transketolase
VGEKGLVFGVSTFGASAPGDVLFEHFDLSIASIVPKIKASLTDILKFSVTESL